MALATFAAHNLPDGMEPTLDSDYVYDPENFSYPHGTHLCAVEIDTETGFTKIRKYVCVDDIGKIINPVIVEGQIHGGLAQGIAQALYEEAVYDAEGNLTTGSLVDYLVPAAPDLPHFDHRPHRDAGDEQPARRQGRRRGRHHRLDPGGHQRGRRRAAAVRRQRHRHAGDPGAGLAGHARRRQAGRAAAGTVVVRRHVHEQHRRGRQRRTSSTPRRETPVIPAQFDYVAPDSVADAIAALAADEDAKVLAGGQSLMPVLRLRLSLPDGAGRPAQGRRAARGARGGRRPRDRRDDAALPT